MQAFDAVRFETLFDDVWDQLYRLHIAWALYFGLFGLARTVERLRAVAPVTIGAIQHILIESMYVQTQRLLDPARSRGRTTASIESVIQRLPTTQAALRRRLQRELKTVRTACEPVKDWRHRHVAHRDALTVLKEHPAPLPPVRAKSVGDAIDYVGRALTAISDELQLGRPYDPHHELSDLDVHKLIERLLEGPATER